jgi:UDP-N-acetylglucosamine acyltransferase
MSVHVHPLAVVDPGAVLGDGVRVGPFAVVGPEVEIGDDSEIGAGAQVYGPARIGRGNRVFPQACIGFDPQDVKYAGERVALEIGERNQFREMCTVHRGTAKGGGVTRIGSDNLFLAYSHIAHDCQVGDRTLFVNNATLAGHVAVHDDATIGAFSSVHQFCRVGRHAYIGGYSVITMDALPFAKTVGMKPAFYGLNRIGLSRKGVDAETIRRLDRALRLVVRSGLNTAQALEKIRGELAGEPKDPTDPTDPTDSNMAYLVAFIESARRGIHKGLPRGGRSGGGEPGDGE